MAEPAQTVGAQATDQAHGNRDSAPDDAPTAVRIVGDPQDAERPEGREAKADEDDAKDLDAQIRAADAAEKQVLTAWVSVALTSLGTVLLLITLALTRQSNRLALQAVGEARRASEAAERSVAIQQDAVAAQLRPYVTFAHDDGAPKAITRGSVLTFYVKNFGQTPALNVRFWRGSEFVSRPIGRTQVGFKHPPESLGSIAPGDKRVLCLRLDELPASDFASIASGREVLLIRVRLEYKFGLNETGCDDITLCVTDRNLATGLDLWLSEEERQRK